MAKVTEIGKTHKLVECCILCGSTGIVHFEEGEGPENTFHRCNRCLSEFIGCNEGYHDLDPRTRLTGLQSKN